MYRVYLLRNIKIVLDIAAHAACLPVLGVARKRRYLLFGFRNFGPECALSEDHAEE